MTHFVGIVVADKESQLPALLEHYDESLDVEPYFRALDPEGLKRMADHYGFDPLDLGAAVAKMADWTNYPGCYGESGTSVGYMSSYNPDSKWDWYQVGGRWGDIVPGNKCKVKDLNKYFHEFKFLPAVIVDSKGWHADKEYGWWGTSNDTPEAGIVAKKLKEHASKNCFIVDFHGA